ncbi:hypothetical protein BG004_006596 [Podila humilis]|nr:hypothetical protein BG004_006596 [Podila humilis]
MHEYNSYGSSEQPPSSCYMGDNEGKCTTEQTSSTDQESSDERSPRKKQRPAGPQLSPYPLRHQPPSSNLVADRAIVAQQSQKSEPTAHVPKTVSFNEDLNTILEFERYSAIIPPTPYVYKPRPPGPIIEKPQSLHSIHYNNYINSLINDDNDDETDLDTSPWPCSQRALIMDMDTIAEPTPSQSAGEDELGSLDSLDYYEQDNDEPFVMSLENTTQQVLDFATSLNRLWAPPKLQTSFSDMSSSASHSNGTGAFSLSPQMSLSPFPSSPPARTWRPDPNAFAVSSTSASQGSFKASFSSPGAPMIRRELSMPNLGTGAEFWSLTHPKCENDNGNGIPPSSQRALMQETTEASSFLSTVDSAGKAGLISQPTLQGSSMLSASKSKSRSKDRGLERSRARDNTTFHPYRRPIGSGISAVTGSSATTKSSSSSSPSSSQNTSTIAESPRNSQPLSFSQTQCPSTAVTTSCATSTPLSRSASFSGTTRHPPKLRRLVSAPAIADHWQPDVVSPTTNTTKAF